MGEAAVTREQKRRRRKREVRSKTEPVHRMTKRDRAQMVADTDYPGGVWRPRTRGECRHVLRPCPFVSCFWHLYLDVSPRNGSIKLNFPDLEVWEMADSCALDVADRFGTTLEDLGAIMNLTRERIRQIEVRALRKIAASHEAFGEDEPDGPVPLPHLGRSGFVADASRRLLECCEAEPCSLHELSERVYGSSDAKDRQRCSETIYRLVQTSRLTKLDDGRFALAEGWG